MAIKEMACGTCAAAVPHGRLSCPACGELLAAVAGGPRVVVGTATPSATPAALYEVGAAPPRSFADAPLTNARPIRHPESELPWGAGSAPGAATGVAIVDAASDPFSTTMPDTALRPTAVDAASSSVARPPAEWAQASAAPGAYVPPSAVTAIPAGPPAPARSWIAQSSSAATLEAPNATGARTATASDAARMAEFVGWLSVAGGALSAVGFLLPWSDISVIGASGVGYFDRWGLAGPGHIVVVLGLLAVLALALVSNTIQVWLRVGLPGLALAALLLGLVWPYFLGPMGAGVGVVIVAVGAAVLGVAGVLALVSDRHPGVDRAV